MKKFCKKCGVSLELLPIEGFNEETGEKNVAAMCPTNVCGHTGISHEFGDFNWKNEAYCIHCGKSYSAYEAAGV